jgi:hypothetical protein
MPATPDQQAPQLYMNALEAPALPTPELCAYPAGCMAVSVLYDSGLNQEGYRDQTARCEDPFPLTQAERLVQAVDAEALLTVGQRCITCPLRRTTIYPH